MRFFTLCSLLLLSFLSIPTAPLAAQSIGDQVVVSVRARGTTPGRQIQLLFDDVPVGQATLQTRFRTFTYFGPLPGNNIKVAYINDEGEMDFTGPAVVVDKVILGGIFTPATLLEGEDQAINTGFQSRNNSECGFRGFRARLNCNGFIDFGEPFQEDTEAAATGSLFARAAAPTTTSDEVDQVAAGVLPTLVSDVVELGDAEEPQLTNTPRPVPDAEVGDRVAVVITARGRNGGGRQIELQMGNQIARTFTLTNRLRNYIYVGPLLDQNIRVAYVNDEGPMTVAGPAVVVDKIIVSDFTPGSLGTVLEGEDQAINTGFQSRRNTECGFRGFRARLNCNGFIDFGTPFDAGDDTAVQLAAPVASAAPDGAVNPLGTATIRNATELGVFPNPVATGGQLNVVLPESIQVGTATIEVLDQTGRRLSTRTVDATQARHTVEVTKLNSGIYLLRVATEEGKVAASHRFIVR